MEALTLFLFLVIIILILLLIWLITTSNETSTDTVEDNLVVLYTHDGEYLDGKIMHLYKHSDRMFFIFDNRSKKLKQIKSNPGVGFISINNKDPNNILQIRYEGKLTFLQEINNSIIYEFHGVNKEEVFTKLSQNGTQETSKYNNKTTTVSYDKDHFKAAVEYITQNV